MVHITMPNGITSTRKIRFSSIMGMIVIMVSRVRAARLSQVGPLKPLNIQYRGRATGHIGSTKLPRLVDWLATFG